MLSPDGGVDQPYFLTRRQKRGDLSDGVEIGGAEHLGKCRPNRISSIACRGIRESPLLPECPNQQETFGRHLIHAVYPPGQLAGIDGSAAQPSQASYGIVSKPRLGLVVTLRASLV